MSKSKKQEVVTKFNAEAKYRVMTHTACEFEWLKTLMQEIGFTVSRLVKMYSRPAKMYCDNQKATRITCYLGFS